MIFCFRGSLGSLADVGRGLVQSLSFRGVRVQGIRVGNVEIPENKLLKCGLQSIYGIGRSRAHQILCDLNMANKLTKELSGRELVMLREEVMKYIIGDNLRRIIQQDIHRLRDTQCYRGIRHDQGLPCRGQRTKTNARTRKGYDALEEGYYQLR